MVEGDCVDKEHVFKWTLTQLRPKNMERWKAWCTTLMRRLKLILGGEWIAKNLFPNDNVVFATLVFKSRPRQRGCKVTRLRAKRKLGSQGKGIARVRAKRKPGSHVAYSRECKKVWGNVREWTLTLPRQLPPWEMESQWTPKTLESDFRGQNSMAYSVFYIIGKVL